MQTAADLTDLRSDTVTRPTAAVREAVATVTVGDDQFAEDPTANLLGECAAAVIGKEAALWLSIRTMSHQLALRVLARPRVEVIESRECRAVYREVGSSSANAGSDYIPEATVHLRFPVRQVHLLTIGRSGRVLTVECEANGSRIALTEIEPSGLWVLLV